MHPTHRSRNRLFAVILATFVCVAMLSVNVAAGEVRVNQIGYEAGRSARAYLMTTNARGGASFAITDSSGKIVRSGVVGATLGMWGKFNVYPIDFTILKHDTYTITVSHGVTGTSPAFRVDTPESLYTAPLAEQSLFLRERARWGEDFIPTPLRTAAGHLNDAKAAVHSSPAFDDDDNIIGSLVPTGATIPTLKAAGGTRAII